MPLPDPALGMSRGQAALDLLAVAMLLLGSQVVLAISGLPLLIEDLAPDTRLLWANALIGLPSLAIVALILILRRQPPRAIGLGKAPVGRTIGAALAAVPVCYIALLIVVPLYLVIIGADVDHLVQERTQFFDEVPRLSIAPIIVFSLFVGLHEEVLFRGLILARLRAVCRSTWLAVIISSLIFGAFHAGQGPIGVVQTSTVGLILACVATLTRSVWPALLTHALFDTIGLVGIPFLQEHLPKLLDQATSMPATM